MKLSTELLNLIVCPVSGDKLIYDQDQSILISKKARLIYPVVDGIPLLLASEAKKIPLDSSKIKTGIEEKEKIES
ncbi:Trm112 family protein [Candidatus Megaera venefica]|jgi:hypothetical protein|uniref:Trm112 family protein n=1 Tax=Candidatus Megaera venefica TaxID=2055910 RepID=A0ABU5NDY1_9RICK|nr:Trm112 family protein [Candidatus Megaera venefica]MBY0534073.1 Trm112 family protein [Rickettsiaceae bacterium]MEA0971361.1 Trm112 family protein [Candidatus Megaera venefica]